MTFDKGFYHVLAHQDWSAATTDLSSTLHYLFISHKAVYELQVVSSAEVLCSTTIVRESQLSETRNVTCKRPSTALANGLNMTKSDYRNPFNSPCIRSTHTAFTIIWLSPETWSDGNKVIRQRSRTRWLYWLLLSEDKFGYWEKSVWEKFTPK